MSYRVRSKFTSTKFSINGLICKIFLERRKQYKPGFYLWNVGFAISKSERQLNDWYKGKKNRRARSLKKRIVNKLGIRGLKKAYEETFKIRWFIEPGDAIIISCTSGKPEKQFATIWRWLRKHPDVVVKPDTLDFYWYRPPYPDDPVWKNFNITPCIPKDRLAGISGSQYFDCFRVHPKVQGNLLSMEQTTDLLTLALATEPFLEMPT